jgi:hypothetical protein
MNVMLTFFGGMDQFLRAIKSNSFWAAMKRATIIDELNVIKKLIDPYLNRAITSNSFWAALAEGNMEKVLRLVLDRLKGSVIRAFSCNSFWAAFSRVGAIDELVALSLQPNFHSKIGNFYSSFWSNLGKSFTPSAELATNIEKAKVASYHSDYLLSTDALAMTIASQDRVADFLYPDSREVIYYDKKEKVMKYYKCLSAATADLNLFFSSQWNAMFDVRKCPNGKLCYADDVDSVKEYKLLHIGSNDKVYVTNNHDLFIAIYDSAEIASIELKRVYNVKFRPEYITSSCLGQLQPSSVQYRFQYQKNVKTNQQSSSSSTTSSSSSSSSSSSAAAAAAAASI